MTGRPKPQETAGPSPLGKEEKLKMQKLLVEKDEVPWVTGTGRSIDLPVGLAERMIFGRVSDGVFLRDLLGIIYVCIFSEFLKEILLWELRF